MFILLLSMVGFLVLSGLMAAVDAAVLSVTHPEIEVLKQEGKWGARRLGRLKHEITRTVVVIVILTNTINVLGPILVSRKAFSLYGNEGIFAISAILAVGTIVFSEIVPKSVGAHYAPLVARVAAPGLLVCRYLLFPLVVVFSWLSEQFTKGVRHIGTEEQIRSLVQIGHRAGHIETDEGRMIHRVFVLNDMTAGEIMTPMDHVKALGSGCTLAQAAAQVCRSDYSRYPVFGRSPDQVKGVVLSREVLHAAQDRPSDGLATVTRSVVVVDAEMKSDELIAVLRQRHAQVAVVQDSGKTVGLVTLNDVLQQLIDNLGDEPIVAGDQ